jgi:mannose-6-phosphate isomerase-like protein (cupin superfamily)
MKSRCTAFWTLLVLVVPTTGWSGAGLEQHERADRREHQLFIRADNVNWGPASPKLPAGAELAVLDGDPTKPGAPFTIRVRVPDGYSVPPHTHPTDEHLTVIKGTILLGMGKSFDRAKLRELPAGSYAKLPKDEPHFNFYKGESIIQLHGIGPYDVMYVNPSDDPSRKGPSK